MTESPRDILLAADHASKPRLDLIRAEVLNRELVTRWNIFGWRALAAAWLLIAVLRALTPAGAVVDPESAALARAQQLLAQEAFTIATRNIEPLNAPRIP